MIDIVANRYNKDPIDLMTKIPWRKVIAMADIAFRGTINEGKINAVSLLSSLFGKQLGGGF